MADEVKKYLDYEGLKHLVEKLTNKIEAVGGGTDTSSFIFKYRYDGTNAPTVETSDTASSDIASLFTTGGACEVTINGVKVSVSAGVSFNLGQFMYVGENTVKINPLEGSMGSSRRSPMPSSYRQYITEIVQWGTCGWGDCSYLLSNATALKSVPRFGMGFAGVTDFSYCIYRCTGLTSLPEGLFDNCPNVTDFSSCFDSCTGLTEIPAGLFGNCPNVTDFSYCIYRCTGLTSLPEGLFDNCPNVTDFSSCFWSCMSLTGESPYTVVDGEKVHLYERADHPDLFTEPKSHSDCFSGCNDLDDWDSIPNDWK